MIEIKSTLAETPVRAVIFGKDGVGKSTFCAAAPKTVFITTEDGLSNIDARAVTPPFNWDALIDAVVALETESSCGTIAIDSLDWAEQLCWAHVCEAGDDKGKKKNIEAFGYGKGYIAALNEWRRLLAVLGRARSAGKNILLIAHAQRKPVKNPTGDDYDAWSIKLNEKAAGLIREWVDVVAFAELDVALVETDGRTKGISNGKRILRTHPSAGFDAKTRFNLPAKLPLDWGAFAQAIKAGRPPSVDAMEKALGDKLRVLGNPDVTLGCEGFLSDRGRTFASLSEAIATVDGYLNEQKEADKKVSY